MGDLVYHLRRTSDWPQVEETDEDGEPTGSMRDATESEILNRWQMRPVSQYSGPDVDVAGVTVSDGDYLWDAVADEEDLPDLPGDKLTEGRQSQVVDGREDAPEPSRYEGIRQSAPDLEDHVTEVVLYRDESGTDLAARLNGMGVAEGERVEKARELAADPDDPVRRRVEIVADAEPGDVVEERREPGGFAR